MIEETSDYEKKADWQDLIEQESANAKEIPAAENFDVKPGVLKGFAT